MTMWMRRRSRAGLPLRVLLTFYLSALSFACTPIDTPTPIPATGPPPSTQLGNGPLHLNAFDAVAPATAPRILWSKQIASGFVAAPVYDDGTLYAASTDGTLFSLDATTGAERWRFAAGGPIATSPALYQGRLVFGGGTFVFAVSAETGAEEWSLRTGSAIVASPSINLDAVAVAGNDGGLYKLRPDSGAIDWRYQTVIGRNRIDSSPAFSDKAIVFGSADHFVHALRPLDGDVLWEFETEDDVLAAPVIVDGTVLAASRDNRLYAIDLETGHERWRFQAADDIDAAPAVDITSGTVFLASRDAHVYALDVATGAERWRFETDFGVRASPALAGNVLLVGTSGGSLYGVEAATGRELWRIAVDGEILAPVVPAAGEPTRLFVVTATGSVIALE